MLLFIFPIFLPDGNSMKVLFFLACAIVLLLGLLPSADAGIRFIHPKSHNVSDVRCMDVKGFKSFANDSTTYTITGYYSPSHYGRVVFIDYTYIEDFVSSPVNSKFLAELAAEEKQKGAVGLIVITAFNLGRLWLFTENTRDPEFPICSIDAIEFYQDAGYFFNTTLEVTQPDKSYLISATISGDHDFWIEYQAAGWNTFLTIFFCTINAAGLAFNIYKVIQFYKAELLGFNLVSICLGFLAIASLLREVWLIDVLNLNEFLQMHVWRFVYYGFWPFEFIASFMVILYWFEVLTSNQIVVTTFFYRFRIPFLIVCIVLLVMQTLMAWAFAFPYGLNFGALDVLNFFFATTYIYVAVLAIIAIFNIAIGSFVIQRVKARGKAQNKSSKELNRTIRQLSNRVAGTAICYLLIIVIFVFSRTADVARTVEFTWPYYYIMATLWIVSNFVQVMTFQVTFRSAGTRSTVSRSTRGGSVSGSASASANE